MRLDMAASAQSSQVAGVVVAGVAADMVNLKRAGSAAARMLAPPPIPIEREPTKPRPSVRREPRSLHAPDRTVDPGSRPCLLC